MTHQKTRLTAQWMIHAFSYKTTISSLSEFYVPFALLFLSSTIILKSSLPSFSFKIKKVTLLCLNLHVSKLCEATYFYEYLCKYFFFQCCHLDNVMYYQWILAKLSPFNFNMYTLIVCFFIIKGLVHPFMETLMYCPTYIRDISAKFLRCNWRVTQWQ